MRAWIEPLGWMLVHSVWLISLIAAVAAVALSLLRRRSANARYLVGCVALVLSVSVLPSVFVWVMAQPREATPPVVAIDTTAAVKATDIIEWDGAGQHFRIEADPDFTPQPVASHLQPTTDIGSQTTHTDVTARDESTTRSAVEEPTTWQRIEARLRPHLTWLVSGWLAGVCLLSLRPLIGWHATWRLRRIGLSEVPDSVSATLHRLAERLGLRRATRIFQSSLVRIPCVVGAIKPVILLPANVLTGLSPEQLEAVLAHELAHVRRHDFLVNALQTVAETLLFYHPAIWWLSRRIRQEREHCCDDLAISVCDDVAGYARMLVSIEGLRGRVPQTSVAAGGGSLVERIRRLLPTEPRHVRAPWQSAIVVLVTLGLLIGSWQGAAGQRKKPEEKPDNSEVTLPNGADGEAKKFSATDAEVDAWVKELASDSAKRRVTAAAEIARRAVETKWLASDPADSVDSRLIHGLAESLGQDEMVMHGNRGQRVGAWCQDALKSLGVPTVSELIRVTQEGNAKARGQAAECLGAIKKVGPNGVEALIELLKHPDYEAHGPASSALRQLTDEPTLIPKLIAACEQGELKPRCWAIGVLGRLPDERGDPVLLKALDAPERDLRLWAAYALSETPHPKLSPQLVSRIKTDDREIRQKLETALWKTAKSNVPALLDGLKDDDARVRAACVFALAHLLPDQAPSVVPGLKAVLNDEDANVRRSVFYLMQLNGRLFDADSFIGPLLKGLSDSDAELRASAASAFQRFAEEWPTDRRPIEPLLKALDDSEPDVVINAIRALAEFRERTAVARLTQLAKAGGKTGEAASQALGVLGDRTSRDILRQNLKKKQPGAIEALGKLHDRESIPQFIELLKDDDESVRAAAAGALVLNPDPRAIEPMISRLKTGISWEGHGVRNNSTLTIADALGRSGDLRGIAALIEQLDEALHFRDFRDFLEHESEQSTSNYPRRLDDRVSTHPFAWPLFRAGLPALPELAKGLASQSVVTRKVCAWVLDNLASQGDLEPADFDSIRPALLTGLRDDDPVVRFCVVKTVGELELPEAEPILLELLETPLPNTRVSETARRPIDLSPAAQIQVEVIRALSSLKTDRARETLLRSLQHPEPAVRSVAAGHLGRFPAAVTVDPLIKALSDPGACAEAARVLGHVGDQRAIAPLIELLKSNPNPTAQANAALALGLLGATDAKPALRDVLNRIPAVDAKSEQFQTQSAAAVSLVQLQDEAGTARLKELLGSSDYETRSNVANRLSSAKYFSEWRPPAALSHEPTREVMRHFAEHAPDTPTRLQLFNALGGQLDQTTREFLERRARDPKETLGWAAWRVLIRPNPAANEEQLLELLDQHKSNDKENNYARREIASFLGQVPTERATDRLLTLTSDADDEVRLATVIALSKHRSPKVDARLRELSTIDPSLQVRARALKVLAVKSDKTAAAMQPKRSPNPLVSVLQPAPEKASLDANGEVMPMGMTQRFGSTRFKVPGWWRRFGFAGNDEWIWIKAGERVSVIHRETGRVVKHHQLRLGEGSVRSLTTSADGTRVAIAMFEPPYPSDGNATANYRVVVMSALTTAHLQEMKWTSRPADLNCLSFSGDGGTLLTGDSRGDVRLWDVETGKQQWKQAFEEGAGLFDAAMSPDGRSVVLGGRSMSFFWKLGDGAGPIQLAKDSVDSVSFAPNGRLFSTIGRKGARLWNSENGELIAHLKSKEFENYGDADFGHSFTPDSKVLAVPLLSYDVIELWDVETKQRVATLPAYQPRGAAISRDGRWLAAAGQDSFTAIFDLKTRQQVNPPSDGHSQEILGVRFAGANSLVSSSAGDARVWDIKSGKQQQMLPHQDKTTTVRGLATSPDGTLIVTSAYDDTLGLWDRATGKRLFTLKGHGHFGGTRAMRFKSDGSQFVSWGDDAVLRWWNAKDGSLVAAHPLEVPGYTYQEEGRNHFDAFSLCAAFAPDTKSIFVVFEKTLSEFDTQTGKRLRQVPIPPHTKPLAVSADGRWLAAGESRCDEQGNTTSAAIVLRDRATLKVVREWPVSDPRDAAAIADPDRKPSISHIAQTDNGMAFSPDSRFLAWSRIDAHPGIDIVKIEHDGLHASIPVESPVWCLDCAANGADLASGHADSTAIVWNRWHPAFTNRQIPREGRWVPANRTVSVKVVDAKTSAPLEGVSINAIRWEGMRQHEVEANAITNAKGIAEFKGLDAMVYRLDLTATKPLPYSRPSFHSIGEMGNEAVIELERACELILKAVDSETGRGIPGVTFGRERALAEYWLQDISPDTLALAKGVAPTASRTGTPARQTDETGKSARPTEPPSYMTDADGVYRCLVDDATWSYSVMEFPPGYDRIVPIKGRHELELETPAGGRVEYTFKLVKTAKAVPK